MSQQPHPDRVRLLPWTVSPMVVDAVIVALMAVGWVLRATFFEEADVRLDALAAAMAVGLVLARRRWPLPTLAVAVVVTVVVSAVTEEPSVLMPATLIVLYSVVTEVEWPIALAAGAAVMVAFSAVALIFLEPGRLAGGLLASIAWPAFATTAGSAIRASRENLAGAQERARRAEATREVEARRRVAEERLRIARDVHDLVAHHLAVVNVQSGVAAHVLEADPPAARNALETVRTSASTAVTELGELLGVLREPDGTGGAERGPVEPTPDLAAIDDLIASFGASGLTIEHRVSGAPLTLAPSVQVAAYRVVQEALTNANKHGDGSALVAQRFADEAMEIEVRNRIGDGPIFAAGAEGSGYGLIGMGERVDAAGGELSIDDADGWFVILARFPALVTP